MTPATVVLAFRSVTGGGAAFRYCTVTGLTFAFIILRVRLGDDPVRIHDQGSPHVPQSVVSDVLDLSLRTGKGGPRTRHALGVNDSQPRQDFCGSRLQLGPENRLVARCLSTNHVDTSVVTPATRTSKRDNKVWPRRDDQARIAPVRLSSQPGWINVRYMYVHRATATFLVARRTQRLGNIANDVDYLPNNKHTAAAKPALPNITSPPSQQVVVAKGILV